MIISTNSSPINLMQAFLFSQIWPFSFLFHFWRKGQCFIFIYFFINFFFFSFHNNNFFLFIIIFIYLFIFGRLHMCFWSPHSFNDLACDCSHSLKRERGGNHLLPFMWRTEQPSLGLEFCEPPDPDQDLISITWYDISIDPKNWLSIVSHLLCSYLKWC